MEPTQELIDDSYRAQILHARAMTPEDRLLAGCRLFEYACTITKEGIRADNPALSENQYPGRPPPEIGLTTTTGTTLMIGTEAVAAVIERADGVGRSLYDRWILSRPTITGFRDRRRTRISSSCLRTSRSCRWLENCRPPFGSTPI